MQEQLGVIEYATVFDVGRVGCFLNPCDVIKMTQLLYENGIDMPTQELELLAERFALERGNRSARLARQFIDGLLSKAE